MLRIGVDDTDSPRGGCTTYVLTELVGLARDLGLDLVGEPRLVRLNPNVPWKTRGNAALGATLGVGVGARRLWGSVGGRPIWTFARGRVAPPSRRSAFEAAAWDRVRELARTSDPDTDPAVVFADRPLPARLYWNAVQEVVEVGTVRDALADARARWETLGSDRGLVGAAAAVAWPGAHPTWELLAYRSASRWGTPREVDPTSVRRAQRSHPELFLCEDPRTRRVLVVPHTACPILYGLRATSPYAARAARLQVRSEPVDRWLLFRTNQGSGDHLRPRRLREMGPYRSAVVSVEVQGLPELFTGGHVRVPISDSDGTVAQCIAFEPTKVLPRVLGALRPGDRVRVWGSRQEDPTFRLEGIRVVRLAAGPSRAQAPRCRSCARRARSLGRGRGYRCPTCHQRWPPEAARRVSERRRLEPGTTYHPTPSARRHLAPRGPEGRFRRASESF